MIEIVKNGDVYKGVKDGTISSILETVINVTNQAKDLAPVAIKNGGRLKNSIMWKVKDSKSSPGDNPEISSMPGEYEGYVGSAVTYSIYQEFGTRRMAPRPFMRPAIALVIKGQSFKNVIKKINQEKMLGALKMGQKRIRF